MHLPWPTELQIAIHSMNMKYKHPGIYYIQFKSNSIFLRTSVFLNRPDMPYKLFRGLWGTYQHELSNRQSYLYKKGHQQFSSLNLTEFSSFGPDEFSSESFAHILGLFSFKNVSKLKKENQREFPFVQSSKLL